MNQPVGAATDSAGNVYVSDTGNNRIQKFSSSGAFLADWGSAGSGMGQFNAPRGIATDSSSNVYVADQLNNRIQKFSSTGAFLTSWGSFGTGDGQFSFPQGVATDSSGNVYVADTENDRIQKFNSTGTFLAKWGSTGSGNSQFDFPVGVATDASANVFVADSFNDRIQKFNSTGTFLAKWGSFGTGDGQFDFPTAVAADSSNIYVADTNNSRIQKFNSTGTFLAKWGSFGTGDGQLRNPFGVAAHSSGDVYVADTDNHRIQNFSSSGTFSAKWGTFGTGDGQFEKPSGAATGLLGAAYIADTLNDRIQKLSSAGSFQTKWGSQGSAAGSFNLPADVATDVAGNVYVADQFNHRVQKFDSSGTFIAAWGSLGSADGQFNAPSGIAVNPSGNVYVADTNNNRIQWFNSSGGFLGKVSSGSGGAFNAPRGVEFDSSGNVYVADSGNHRIQKLDPSALPLITWGSQGSGDGQFQSPWGVDVDSAGRVYVVDQFNHRIQRFNADGSFIDKFGSFGTGDGQFSFPRGLAIDSLDTLYVADTGNHRIQKFSEQPGQIVVVKDAIPNDAQNFDFTTNADPSRPSFSLDDDSDPALSNTKTLTVAPGGGYSVSEAVPAGWTQTSATCSDGSPVSNISVSVGETVTCTFTNNKQATIIIKKDAVPDAPQDFVFSAGGGLSPASFTLDDDSDPTRSSTQTFTNVAPGSYSVSESVPANWTQTSATCDDGSPISNISVSAAETVTCTFTNKSGKIVVVKDARPDDPQDFAFTAGGGLSPSSFTLDDDADPTRAKTQTIFNVAPGSGYSLAESMPTGWEEAGAVCDDGSPISNINVSLGETVTCTFTNDKQGKIVVVKEAHPENPQNFTFTAVGGLVPTGFTLDDDSDPTLLNIKTYSNVPVGGGYSIFETVPEGWAQTSATCSDGSPVSNISVSVGETVTCTFVNRATYPRPGTATPLRVPLVPAFKQCPSAGSSPQNGNHVAPFAFSSCASPVQESTVLTTSTVGKGSGSVRLDVLVGPPPSPPDEADVRIRGTITDVRCTAGGAVGCSGAGADYTGKVIFSTTIRITDGANGPSGVDPATVEDTQFSVPVNCVGNGTPDLGSTCTIDTTSDTLVPGFAIEGARQVIETFTINVSDAGSDGNVTPTAPPPGLGCPPICGNGDEAIFLRQGFFLP